MRLVLVGATALASCGVEAAGPDWVDLTEGFDPAAAFEQNPSPEAWGNSLSMGRKGAPRSGLWLHRSSAQSEWQALGRGFWRLPRSRFLYEDWVGQTAPEMTSGGLHVEPLDGVRAAYWGSALDHYPPTQLPASYRLLANDLPTFALGRRWAYWIGEAGGDGPGRTRLSTWLDFGSRIPRESRLEWGSISCRGIPLLTGIPQSIEVPATGLTRLDFASASWGEGEEGEATFKLFYGDETIWVHKHDVGEKEHIDFHSLLLPRSVRVGSELRFELSGPPTIGAILTPRVYSLDWAEHRRNLPNLVVYSAGSFRADNLVDFGGDVRIAPNLNAFAKEGSCFTQAYAPATNGLLSNAAIATGRYAHQVPVDKPTSVLPSQVVTLAEHLRGQGYRTVAITDGGVFSRRVGFSQGFEWFEENLEAVEDPKSEGWSESWPMLGSVERILNSGDGRPLFLYVHSERLQWPYRVSERARRDMQGRSRDLRDLRKRRNNPAVSIPPGVPRKNVSNGKARTAYRGASRDSDWAFGEFRGLVESFGVLQDSYLVFLSDHGESFGSHGAISHGKSVWQSEAHVPLIISGPNMRGSKFDHPVSLTSLAGTLVELVGVQAEPSFRGPSLLDSETNQGVFVFQGFDTDEAQRYVALIQGAHKAIFRWNAAFIDKDDLVGAFEVVRDPRETEPLESNGADVDSLLKLLQETLPELLRANQRSNRVSNMGR